MLTPRYEYSRSKIRERISYLNNLSAPFGLLVRYAIKANPHSEIIKLMNDASVHFDASSSYEATELLAQGIPGNRISLSSQQSPHARDELFSKGVLFVATSLKQLEFFSESKNHPLTVGVRINPDVGHGHNKRTTTGGVGASFGIWHEYGEKALALAEANGTKIDRLHFHVGSGADPRVWGDVMDKALAIAANFPDVLSVNIGGGYKVHRYGEETETDMAPILKIFSEKISAFRNSTQRELQLEIEPGTYFIAHAGTLIATVDDIVDTGKNGYNFLRLNTGMNDFLRSALYGAQHKIEVMNDAQSEKEYVVVGHNCESGDLFTPAAGNPEELETRTLKEAKIGDEVRIYDVGAYGASMRAKGYNSFPDAEEVMVE